MNGGKTLVDSVAAALAVKRPASTVRRWAVEGRLVRHGKDAAGRTLYDLAEVYKVAAGNHPTKQTDRPT